MIYDGNLLLCLINFGFIALLPRKFFKQGARLDAQFWLTAAPLFISPACLGLAKLGILPPFIGNEDPWGNLLALLGICIATLSILFLGMSLGTHRVPLHMFHDRADQHVSHLVTYGPYRYVRHPIYSSYLLGLFAAALVCPQIGTLACFTYGLVTLTATAIKEERRLCLSPELGEEYAQYMKVTGRFLPPLSAFHMRGSPVEKPQSPPAPRPAEASRSSDS